MKSEKEWLWTKYSYQLLAFCISCQINVMLGHYMKSFRNTKINDPKNKQKRRNKYIIKYI